MYLPDIVRLCHRRFYLYGKGDTAAIVGILSGRWSLISLKRVSMIPVINYLLHSLSIYYSSNFLCSNITFLQNGLSRQEAFWSIRKADSHA
jgi:hypothetical protein